jgi:magnesium chelatase family protein
MRVKTALLDPLLLGGLGASTSRLARGPTTFPEMSVAEAIETTRIYRVAGLTGDRKALVRARPFRAPITPFRMSG